LCVKSSNIVKACQLSNFSFNQLQLILFLFDIPNREFFSTDCPKQRARVDMGYFSRREFIYRLTRLSEFHTLKERMKTQTKKRKQRATPLTIVMFFVLVILFGIVVVALPTIQTKKLSYGATIPFTPVPAKPDLQLEWFLVPTNSPPQGNSVPKTTIVPPTFTPVSKIIPTTTPPASGPNPATCAGYVNSGVPVPSSCDCPGVYVICPYTTSDPTDVTVGPNGCQDPLFVGDPPKTGKFCIDKPVVYLYPTKPTRVNVAVQTSGSVVVSDPHYPVGGWQNVLADPDGNLHYQGHAYSELFYETSVTSFEKPVVGITIPVPQLAERLTILLDRLGLVGSEKQEFLEYWVPRLRALKTPYIYFSILSPSSKSAIDALDITPKPDTLIDFIAYFKPISTPDTTSVLQLPQPPKRSGFTAVEWGGVIDR
jgi:hypothetical protein